MGDFFKENCCSLRTNRINGVIKKGKTWLIPQDSIKPADARKNNHGQRGVSKC